MPREVFFYEVTISTPGTDKPVLLIIKAPVELDVKFNWATGVMQRTNRAQQLYFQILEFAFKLCCFYLLYSSLYVCVYNVLFLGEVVYVAAMFSEQPRDAKKEFQSAWQ